MNEDNLISIAVFIEDTFLSLIVVDKKADEVYAVSINRSIETYHYSYRSWEEFYDHLRRILPTELANAFIVKFDDLRRSKGVGGKI